jgi:hypothetical protein
MENRAEKQVLGVLSRLDSLYASGHWASGRRYTDGGYCLIGAIDASTRWTVPGVRERVVSELARTLPLPLRALGLVAGKGAALAFYNDWVGRARGVRRLVKATLARVDDTWPLDLSGVGAGRGTFTAERPPAVAAPRELVAAER